MTGFALKEEALPFVLWARIWSQLVSDEERAEAWQLLDLPSSFSAQEDAYWTAFHVGLPAAPVSLLFHAALDLDGTNVREDLMRVSGYLGLMGGGHRLPPDHLAAACEVLAMAFDRGEYVLVEELSRRYFHPWCRAAGEKLEEAAPTLKPLVQRFSQDLALALSMTREVTAKVL